MWHNSLKYFYLTQFTVTQVVIVNNKVTNEFGYVQSNNDSTKGNFSGYRCGIKNKL